MNSRCSWRVSTVSNVSRLGAGFIVLSVGGNDDVAIGFPFDVYRDGTYVGRVVVDKVFPESSIAKITATNPGQEFRIHDNATTRL